MQRIRSFVHFGSRRVSTALSLPEGDNRVSFFIGVGILALILLVIDLAISGGLQLSVGGRSYDAVRSNVEDFAMEFYNRLTFFQFIFLLRFQIFSKRYFIKMLLI